ncbi:DUF262 domain-containing protein [Flavobacterium rakeshii]|uniref:DUF262 domain-containing protein n=1 Tax=Flavobacterium rakeshii TaxID=1038845 RepID=A0A6N8H7Z6_9FLAO|nr:DUF262 domain-containing protein [Flavobacterium rakeshii]MUV02412.1 DUF262 domain-containing protein [Flavobacterium rakeshii]
MAKSNLVNLDALIKREDFGVNVEEQETFESFSTISLRDFTKGALVGPNLRKPDFQRETNHWRPEQVLSLLESFVNGDLVPSVILWKSPTYLFVIDGGHRLSALRAWVEDDYGDGALSYEYFGRDISPEQKRIAEKTRRLVNNSIGSYKQLELKNDKTDIPAEERRKISKMISRGLQVQWVKGDADKAEQSFFKINTQGTPLDSIEELLLKNRKKPIPISARAIIRAGTGHKYWSYFSIEKSESLENMAKDFHKTLFEPEIKRPIKTLDLPLGGSKGVRTALDILIDFMVICNKDQLGRPNKVDDYEDDYDGEATVGVLRKSLKLAKRISGNDSGSLGLHPAVYFYGPSGRHSRAMFMGVTELLSKKLINNDSTFFVKFTHAREKLEEILIGSKDLIATILQKHLSHKRNMIFSELLNELVNKINKNELITDADIVKMTKLEGKIVLGEVGGSNTAFNDETKSKSFIYTALKSAMKCPICKGYLDPEKSISYDHIQRKSEGGMGDSSNCQLTHPYCNQSIKN